MRRSFSSSSRTSSKSPAVLASLVLAAALAACGGSGNGGGSSPPPPGGGTAENPCATSSLEADLTEGAAPDAAAFARKKEITDGNPRGRLLDALWLNKSRGSRARGPSFTAAGNAIDAGEIAIVQDEGDLIEPPNTYDLRNVGLRFTRNSSGGYDVTRIDAAFRTAVGNRITLTDDDSAALNVPFSFSFYGRTQSTAFVNSDGNITFETEDHASTDRNVARLLTGPPRVALFFADLDPSTAGRVLANAAATEYTVTWCGIRGFDSTQTMNAQVTLLPSGVIEMKYADVSLAEAVVGLSPGRTGDFTTVNLSDAGTIAGGSGAVGERFAANPQLDAVALARKFYQTHPDNYDQLVIFSDASVVEGDAFAFEVTVANEIRGIGLNVFDAARDFGSSGRLRSYVLMDALGKYPDDPQQTFLGENNAVSVLGQEVGHRWL
ncbi:MAG TPA: hypothetical protein VFJ02_10245, partial [Vicinamibacterales bacterium]|nr:hypothetical protein [Vicinamibacterales bacterium]